MIAFLMWALFGFGVLLAWFENYWIPKEPPLNRPLFYTYSFQHFFTLVQMVFMISVFLGILLTAGIIEALIAVISYLLFRNLTIKYYTRREIARHTRELLEASRMDPVLVRNGLSKEAFAARLASAKVKAAIEGKPWRPQHLIEQDNRIET